MGRFLSEQSPDFEALRIKAAFEDLFSAGRLPLFGGGKWAVFLQSYNGFALPFDVTRIRVRVFGAGGGGASDLGNGSPGGTSSFGALISATGGGAGLSGQTNGGVGGVGGIGVGGDIQYSGGTGGTGAAVAGSLSGGGGGGGAGSQVGIGGRGADGTAGGLGGGGGGVLLPGSGANGGSLFGGPNILGVTHTTGTNQNPTNSLIRFPTEAFPGGTSVTAAIISGLGAGGTCVGPGTPGGVCGGGAGASATQGGAGGGGSSQLGGGGGGRNPSTNGFRAGGGGGGGGFAMGVFTITGGQSFNVVVGAGGTGATQSGNGGPGIVIVEY